MKRLFVLMLLGCAVGVRAADVSFIKDVAPVFVAKCLACHNAEKAKGGFRLHSFAALLTPGSSKDAPIVPGQPGASLLFQLITATNEEDRMPQKDDALPAAQVAVIKKWIEAGGKFDGADRSQALAILSPAQHPAAPAAYPVPMPVTALAFDPTGESLAASGYHEITVWDSHSGKLRRRIGHVAERTFDLAYSPDGEWMACASGTPGKIGELKLFHATNAGPERLLLTSADAVLTVAFTGDGKRLAAGGADNTIRVWDVASGKLLQTIEQHADWVLSVDFSPDGTQLASGSRDKSARVFDALSGELETTHTGHGDFVMAVAWADNKSIISASRERVAHRWNARGAKKTAEFSGWDAAPTRLIVAGNRLFSACMDHQVREHDLEKKEVVRTFSGAQDAVYALAWHGPSQRLAAGMHDGEVRIWNARDGSLALKFLAAPGYAGKISRAQ